uniref:Protein lin-52 homolog n=1 Tax=Syphacia muris TaxID=451379 RepID=A0A158R618_9BILA
MESKPLSSYLECKEEIDQRKSPELWPEEIPGAWEVSKANMSCMGDNKPATRFRTDLDPQDVRLVNELGQLNADQLMEYVKNLQNNAFTLGIEEGSLTFCVFLLNFVI